MLCSIMDNFTSLKKLRQMIKGDFFATNIHLHSDSSIKRRFIWGHNFPSYTHVEGGKNLTTAQAYCEAALISACRLLDSAA
jgi:hypothetical protein